VSAFASPTHQTVYTCKFASMRELSLSFVCVEPMQPGVAGACAFLPSKSRGELIQAAFAYAVSFGPRSWSHSGNSLELHDRIDCQNDRGRQNSMG